MVAWNVLFNAFLSLCADQVRDIIMPEKYSLSLLLLAIVLFSSGCSRKEPVKIGFLGGLTGRSADLGIGGVEGCTLAIEQANLAGGINGSPIQLLVKNDEQNQEVAVREVKSLIASGVKVIIGPMTSIVAEAVVPVINASKTILLSPTVTSTDFSGKDDNFLRICGSLDKYAAKSALYHFEKLAKRRATIVYDISNKSYSERWLQAFQNTFEEKGGKVVATFAFTSEKDKVFLDKARKILAVSPDLVVIIANSVDAASITAQLRKLNPKTTISLAEWSYTDRFIELTGRHAEGVYVSQFIDLNSSAPDYLTFRTAYKIRFGRMPSFPALTSYEAAIIAIDALRKQSADKRTVKEIILSTGKLKGVQETIEIDRFGDSQKPTHLSVIRGGKFFSLE